QDPRRAYWNYAGIAVSSLYMLLTIINKFYVNTVFEKNFEKQGIAYERYSTKPTPFNSLLWSATAEGKDGYYIGYYSLMDSDKEVSFRYFSKNHKLLSPYTEDEKLKELLEITEGYYTVEKKKDEFVINDLRFGQLDGWGEGKENFTFAYLMKPEREQLLFSQKPNDLKKARALMGDLWDRVLGNKKL
ncbi:MAG: metal-dependent hydrolase, partial [Cytophagaceae bacterium]